MCKEGTAGISEFSCLLSLGVDPDIHDKVLFGKHCYVGWVDTNFMFSTCRVDFTLSGMQVDVQELTFCNYWLNITLMST